MKKQIVYIGVIILLILLIIVDGFILKKSKSDYSEMKRICDSMLLADKKKKTVAYESAKEYIKAAQSPGGIDSLVYVRYGSIIPAKDTTDKLSLIVLDKDIRDTTKEALNILTVENAMLKKELKKKELIINELKINASIVPIFVQVPAVDTVFRDRIHREPIVQQYILGNDFLKPGDIKSYVVIQPELKYNWATNNFIGCAQLIYQNGRFSGKQRFYYSGNRVFTETVAGFDLFRYPISRKKPKK